MDALFTSFTCVVIIGALVINGCTQERQNHQSISFDSPRATNQAVIVSDSESQYKLQADPIELNTEISDGLERLSQALDDLDTPYINPGVLEAYAARQNNNHVDTAQQESSSRLQYAHDSNNFHIPIDSTLLLPLSKLSDSSLAELLQSIQIEFESLQGYRIATTDQSGLYPQPPSGVKLHTTLIRVNDDQSVSSLRFGSIHYLSQPPQIWIQGIVDKENESSSRNPDIELAQSYINQSVQRIAEMTKQLTHADLKRKLVQLSYVDSAGAMNVLKGLGVNTQPTISNVPQSIPFEQLPLVTVMPTPAADQTGLLSSGNNASSGSFGQTNTPTNASPLNPNVNAGPSHQLMVYYHPAYPEQFSLVRSLLDDYIDRPARQVFIEGMVLEISEDGLEELGVEWSFEEGTVDFVLGSLDPTGVTDTITFSNLDSRDVLRDWGVKVRALVRDGKAEVLSRPSILTLNNRQATIRVGEDIPIATSQEGVLNNSNKVAFNFKYIPTGILLNIRPRITEDGEEVSMLIDTVVSAVVPNRELEIRSVDGDLLASAPTISTRRVQTYARIGDTTPFIIGGLVSRDISISKDKVPLLGDLPLIGPAFRSESTSTQKTEVIIVLTPYVLPDDQVVSRALPKDDDLFDSKGNDLFRDAFRIHAEDVFDLRFLAENKRLMQYRDYAKDLISKNFTLATKYPFNEFAEDTIPGEEILVQRMIYELIKRTEVDQRLNPDRIIYFEAKEYEGYTVRFLNHALTTLGDGITADSFFERETGKAIAFTFKYSRESIKENELASEPIPEISLIDCPDRDTWQQLLWDLNQPSTDGIDQYTILIHSPKDIERLSRALMLKRIIQLNGGEEALSLDKFSVGKILHTPVMGPQKVSVIDADVAKYFFHTELYYAAIIKRIEQTIDAFDAELGAINTP